MNDLYESLEDLCDIAARELKEANEKIRSAGGKISPGDVDYLDKLTHMMKSIKTTKAMIDAEEEGGDWSYNRGRSYNDRSYRASGPRRDNMGRYSGRRAYDDGIADELRELMRHAPEDDRQRFQRIIDEMGR